MSRETILSKVKEILIDILDNQKLHLDEDTLFVNIDGWDSIAFVTLIASLETEYGISMDLKEIQKISVVKELINLMQSL